MRDNEPMTGVFVSGQGTDAGGLTDNTGEFMLAVPDTVKFLDFSMLGYKELSMALTGKDFLEVFMEPSDIQLDEVIVIGYGTATKKDFTGVRGNSKRAGHCKGSCSLSFGCSCRKDSRSEYLDFRRTARTVGQHSHQRRRLHDAEPTPRYGWSTGSLWKISTLHP